MLFVFPFRLILSPPATRKKYRHSDKVVSRGWSGGKGGGAMRNLEYFRSLERKNAANVGRCDMAKWRDKRYL